MFMIMEGYMKNKNKHLRIVEEEYESKFDDYKDIDKEEKEKNINQKLGEITFHQLLQRLGLSDLLWDFDAVSFKSKNYE